MYILESDITTLADMIARTQWYVLPSFEPQRMWPGSSFLGNDNTRPAAGPAAPVERFGSFSRGEMYMLEEIFNHVILKTYLTICQFPPT